MDTLKRFSLLTCVLILSSLLSLHAQDFHYSQFSNAPMFLSPGLTGVFAGDTRINGSYRSQWTKVPVDYKTFSLMVDHKYTCGNSKPGFFASGLGLNYDQAGDSKLTRADISLYGSYTHPMSDQIFLTAGLQAGFGQRRFDETDLRFDAQFNTVTGEFDETLSHGETFGNKSHIFFDAGAGINFRWQALKRGALVDLLDKRSKLDVGVGIHHFTRPDMGFIEDVKAPLYIRVSPYAMANLQLAEPLDLRLAFTAQFQGSYREKVASAGVNIHLNRNLGQQLALMLGIGYRFDEFGDAFFPVLEFAFFDQLKASVSYDFNISDFDVATDGRGGLELNVRYLFKKVCPLPNFKFCPLI